MAFPNNIQTDTHAFHNSLHSEAHHSANSANMSRQSPVPRSHSRASFYSTTTYHSFQDVELYEPGCTPDDQGTSTARAPMPVETPVVRRQRTSRRDDFDKNPASFQMVRQDSGYESSTPTRNSQSSKRYRHSSHTKSASSPPRTESQSRASTSQKRPALRRSRPISNMPRSSMTTSRSPPRSNPQQQPQHNDPYSYFQFPSPEQLDQPEQEPQLQLPQQQEDPNSDIAPVSLHLDTLSINQQSEKPTSSHSHIATVHPGTEYIPGAETTPLTPLPPPQTTHYWTSDRTRRLEYAAIDAASRGVRGWVMRNCVPECFVPKERRRVCFDDDSGSVRRYRLDLEIECPEDSVPPSPVGEKPRGFRARRSGGGGGRGLWAKLRGKA